MTDGTVTVTCLRPMTHRIRDCFEVLLSATEPPQALRRAAANQAQAELLARCVTSHWHGVLLAQCPAILVRR